MLYPEVALDRWITKYCLPVQIKKCSNCSREFSTSVPVLLKGYAGLETPTHECGRHFNIAIFTPTTIESRAAWEKAFS